jgi:uncharacterized membrane protein (UPF0127 family)
MKKKRMFYLAIFLLLLVLFYLICASKKPCEYDIERVVINGNAFNVELATTREERSEGLMFREDLPEEEGMLFIFDAEEVYSFWMMNTYIPLDIIWMDAGREIVYIERDAQPCGEICTPIDPNTKAKYVLEINGGLSDEMGIKEGNVAVFE